MDVQGSAAASAAAPQTAPPPSPTQPASAAAPAAPERPATLTPTLTRLFGPPDAPQKVDLQISYRVEKPDEFVTVITDPATGEEVAQFPAEIMIRIAQFFDKETGVTLDSSH